MAHRFLMKQVAQQAGVSLATVDRVIHRRPGVRQQTRIRVEQALYELTQQEQVLGLKGRRFMFDLVMETPRRFSDAVTAALETQLNSLQPAAVRVRYHLAEHWPVGELRRTLEKIGNRGTQGLLLKLPHTPELGATVGKLAAQGIAAVTLVTDLDEDARLAYVGLDNVAAGATAAYLTDQWMATDRPLHTLLSLSSLEFHGEEQRELGYLEAIKQRRPLAKVSQIAQGSGLYTQTFNAVTELLEKEPDINSVYSIGGANQAILAAFDSAGRSLDCFIAHDLDRDNLTLLRQQRLSAVLHHDLKLDMRYACELLLSAHGITLPQALPRPQNLQIITPYNIPV